MAHAVTPSRRAFGARVCAPAHGAGFAARAGRLTYSRFSRRLTPGARSAD